MSRLKSCRKAAALGMAFVMMPLCPRPAEAAEQAFQAVRQAAEAAQRASDAAQRAVKAVGSTAAQPDAAAVVEAAAKILYDNEGSYDSVNANDNGAVSIGKLQWHGQRALSLLQTIVLMNAAQAKTMLGTTFYKEVTLSTDTSRWASRTLTASEAAAVRKLLASSESKEAQDTLAVTDITNYIKQAQQLGITNEPAFVYFADLTNQGGSAASGRVAASAAQIAGGYPSITLNELHEAAVCDSVMGLKAYLSRRFQTYAYAADLGWAYCSKGDSYIPINDAAARDKGAAWVQRSLNTCMNAGLIVSNNYDDATKTAVSRFQSAKGIPADGYAGKDTIAALIKAVVKGEKVTPGAASQPGADNPADNQAVPDDPVVNPDPPANSDPVVQNPVVPDKKAVLTASKLSYAANDTHKPFQLKVTSNHSESPITYQSSDESVVEVSSRGKVTVKGAGAATITASQAQTDTYKAASAAISVTIYSTSPGDYEVPDGALYAGKVMQKEHVQWLQAALTVLDGAEITVSGTWSKTMTKLVTGFQEKCGILADGIAGTQTQELVKQMLAVKAKKPAVIINSSEHANTLTWKKYEKANRVYIYRKEKGGSYKRIKTITNMSKSSFQDETAEKGITYYYVLRYGFVQNKICVKGEPSKGAAGVRG